MVIVWGVVEVVLLWQLSSLASSSSPSVAPLVVTLLAANVAHAILALRYFFLIPVVFDAVVAILLAVALFR
jgi:hypothetical protein